MFLVGEEWELKVEVVRDWRSISTGDSPDPFRKE